MRNPVRQSDVRYGSASTAPDRPTALGDTSFWSDSIQEGRQCVGRKIRVELIDDIDGALATETVRFSYQCQHYEIDLCKEHVAALDEMLAPYILHAREARDPLAAPGGGATHHAAIRAWARQQGIHVFARGRIPREVVAKYEATHAEDWTGGECEEPAGSDVLLPPVEVATTKTTSALVPDCACQPEAPARVWPRVLKMTAP